MSNFIQNRHYSNITIRSKVLENTGHSGTKSETYNRGLQFIFEKADLPLTNDLLEIYPGRYIDTDGNKIEIRAEKSRLLLYYSPHESEPLKYGGNNLFYSNAGFLNLVFSPDGKTFQLNQFGKRSTFSRK